MVNFYLGFVVFEFVCWLLLMFDVMCEIDEKFFDLVV